MLSSFTTPALLLRSPISSLNWADDLADELFQQPRMEIWPASRILNPRSFFNRQMGDVEREMSRVFGWADHRLQNLSEEDPEQKMKVIEDDAKEFCLAIGCKNFKPEQIQCKLDGGYLQVEGKHEQSDDKGNMTKRHFVRRVLLPENAELDKVTCTFKANGTLSITIPKKAPAIEEPKNEKMIPIQKETQADNQQEEQKH